MADEVISSFFLLLLQYEWNARTQLTMWFYVTKTNQSKLHDYGNGISYSIAV